MVEAWKLMAALTVFLVLFGIFTYFGISEPAEIAGALLLGTFFLFTTWIGYRIGKRIQQSD